MNIKECRVHKLFKIQMIIHINLQETNVNECVQSQDLSRYIYFDSGITLQPNKDGSSLFSYEILLETGVLYCNNSNNNQLHTCGFEINNDKYVTTGTIRKEYTYGVGNKGSIHGYNTVLRSNDNTEFKNLEIFQSNPIHFNHAYSNHIKIDETINNYNFDLVLNYNSNISNHILFYLKYVNSFTSDNFYSCNNTWRDSDNTFHRYNEQTSISYDNSKIIIVLDSIKLSNLQTNEIINKLNLYKNQGNNFKLFNIFGNDEEYEIIETNFNINSDNSDERYNEFLFGNDDIINLDYDENVKLILETNPPHNIDDLIIVWDSTNTKLFKFYLPFGSTNNISNLFSGSTFVKIKSEPLKINF